MRWLADQGHPVLGIELAPEAIEQFLAQRSGGISRYTQAGFEVCRQGNIELWCGDFFHLHIQQAAEVEAFYDRASLIALPPVPANATLSTWLSWCHRERKGCWWG